MRIFWKAAIALNPDAAALAVDRHFPYCQPDRLDALPGAADGGMPLKARTWAVRGLA